MSTFFIILVLWALFPGLISTLSYTIFYYEWANHRDPLFRTACPGPSVLALLRGVGSSLLSQTLLFLTYPLGFGRLTPQTSSPKPDETVVVCLHGLYHNHAAFLAIRPSLRLAGFRHVLLLDYRSFRDDFETIAERLLTELHDTIGLQAPIIFIGHSLGGLLARRLAGDPTLYGRVRAIITLGSPHGGSKLASLAPSRLGRSLMPESPLIKRLAALADPPGVPGYALFSPVDNMVIPLAGLAIRRPVWTMLPIRPISHASMLYHPAVIARVTALARQHGLGQTDQRI